MEFAASALTPGWVTEPDDPAVHWLPAPASWMSLTCQPPAAETTVTAYWVVLVDVPCVVASCCAMLTTNVIDPGPNERIEAIPPLLVETCFCAVRCAATPGVA